MYEGFKFNFMFLCVFCCHPYLECSENSTELYGIICITYETYYALVLQYVLIHYGLNKTFGRGTLCAGNEL